MKRDRTLEELIEADKALGEPCGSPEYDAFLESLSDKEARIYFGFFMKTFQKAIKEAYVDERELCEHVLRLLSAGFYRTAEAVLKRNIESLDNMLSKPDWQNL